jgi:putative PEP-CTERM system TPR-repeat lipoprotein
MRSVKKESSKVLSALLMSLLLVACGDTPDDLLLSAKDYLSKKDNKAAVIQIKNALQAKPDLPEARFLLGSTLLIDGDPVGAETELRKALELKYPQDLVVPRLATALLGQGHTKKVVDEFARMSLSEPTAMADLQMSLAAAYAAQGKIELSQQALSAALRVDPDFAPALMAQARQKASVRDFDGAMALVTQIIAKSPADHEAWKLKGDLVLYAKTQTTEAMEAYRKSVSLKPDFLVGQAAITALLLQEGNLPDAEQQLVRIRAIAPRHPQTLLLEAQLAFQKKDFRQARGFVQQVLRAVPASLPGLQLAGAIELQQNSLPSAQDYLNRALQIAPDLNLARRLLVTAYLRAGQPAKAMTTLLPGLDRDSIDPELLSVAGEVYLQSGDLKQAELYFAQAARQSPENGKKRTVLALTHLMGGQVDAAFQELQNIAGSDPGVTADLALINVHLRRREFDKALKAVDGLEKKQPNQPLAAQLRARTLVAKGDQAGARASFERALVIDPAYFAAAASLAGMDMADKRPDLAKKRFEALIVKNPKSSRAYLALADISARSGASPDEVVRLMRSAVQAEPDDPFVHLLLIDFHLRNKDLKSAASAAQNAVAAVPESADALAALGRTQQMAGEFNQAMASYNKLATMQPRSVQPYLRMAEVQLAGKNRDAALRSLRNALELKPDSLEVQRAMVGLDVEDKRFADAVTTARTVQKQRPKEMYGYLLEGDIYVTQKNWENALAAYRAGLKQIQAPELAVKQHAVLQASGKGAEADKLAATWQKDNPKDALFLFYLGDNALARKDYLQAEKMYSSVTRLLPNHAMAYNNLAWVSGKLKREGALAYAEKANALAPNQPVVMDTLAMLLSEKGDYAQALALQNQILALQPQNPLFKLNLAKIHIQGGQKALARKELEALSQLGAQFPAQSEVAALLTAL